MRIQHYDQPSSLDSHFLTTGALSKKTTVVAIVSLMVTPVRSTSHVRFDETFKTFRLCAGSSVYAFCITPELTLEHLYWGPKIQDGYDLRYLSESARMAHFDTVEAAPLPFEGRILLEAENLEEIEKLWKENRHWNSQSSDEADYVQRRRLENFSWRIMSKFHQEELRNTRADESGRPKRGLSVSFDEMSLETEKHQTISRSAYLIRRRSVSSPMSMIDPLIDLSDVCAMSNLECNRSPTRSSTSPAKRFFDVMASGREQARGIQSKHIFDRKIGTIGKSTLCCEYSDHGTGDFRTPSFIVVDNFNGSAISPLKYRSHQIYKGKMPMQYEHMPSIRCLSESEASTLVVTLMDTGSGLEVDLVYTAMHNFDCITRRSIFRNNDARPTLNPNTDGEKVSSRGSSKVVQKASSLTIDFESSISPFYLVQLSGSWARERYVEETKLTHGMRSFGSMRGVSSHQHSPFAAITLDAPSEVAGEVKGFALVYSGNFLIEAELNEMGRLRFNIGIHPMGLQWYLKPGASFETPEAVLVRSADGMSGMSRTLHRLILDRLIPRNWSDQHPPILLNTWEAKYFHVNHSNVVEMAKLAAKIGIDLIVLDDGWFGDRDNDRCSLGDWVANLSKFPTGIKGLADDINALGCKFGLWIEPEMVSEESLLFASHPDWYFHVPGRPRQIGRNQMVLDLSRQDVRDYLFLTISSILSSGNVEYVKWDMNRPLTEVYSAAATQGEVWQAEISHRYVLGVYELQHRLTTRFPNILFENCASGGGRFDLGMLYFSPQIWCSDNTDALVRLKVQYGTSLAYPARTVGAHISTVPNHLTGNTTHIRTRAAVAMCGSFGFELDISTASVNDRLSYQKEIELFKELSPIVRWGDIYRLWDPFKVHFAAWMYVARDKSQAAVFAFCMNSDHWSNLVPRLQLQGLVPHAEYDVSEPFPSHVTQSTGSIMMIESEVPMYQLGTEAATLTGKILMTAGLPIKFFSSDDCAIFRLRRAPSPGSSAKKL